MSTLPYPLMSPEFDEQSRRIALVNTKPPRPLFVPDESIPLLASRLLLIIRIAGRPQNEPKVEGRTKLAKMDFFVRYPQFLERAARKLLPLAEIDATVEQLGHDKSVESTMIRYRYGPWDPKYYVVLAYLYGKALIDINVNKEVDHYVLSEIGRTLTSNLMIAPEFAGIVARCVTVGRLFGERKGTWIKDFIYQAFPEVVRTPYNKFIPSSNE
jgi:hypothetical protein